MTRDREQLPGVPYTPGLSGRPDPYAPPTAAALASGGAVWHEAVALFDRGFYWEAHERLEVLWHAHGRSGPAASLMRGLIALCAAAVKRRQGSLGRVTALGARARLHVDAAGAEVHAWGLDEGRLHRCIDAIAQPAPAAASGPAHTEALGSS